MVCIIYALKIFLLRKQFTFTSSEINGIKELCICVIKNYIKPGFSYM